MLALTRTALPAGRDSDGFVLPRALRRPVRLIERFVTGAVDVPKHATATANLTLLGLALAYGIWAGGHVPTVVDATAKAAGFGVREAVIRGNNRTSEEAIAAAAGLGDAPALVGFDADGARQRIAALPWVQSASVRKVYPGQLVIDVSERTPAAVWQHDGDLTLVDREGIAIASFDDPDLVSLPLVIGVGANEAAGEALDLMAAEPGLGSRAKAFLRVGERRWDVIFDNGVTARLPEAGATEAFIELARLEDENGVLARDILAIDLRVGDRIAFQLSADGAKARAEAVKNAIAAQKKGRRT